MSFHTANYWIQRRFFSQVVHSWLARRMCKSSCRTMAVFNGPEKNCGSLYPYANLWDLFFKIFCLCNPKTWTLISLSLFFLEALEIVPQMWGVPSKLKLKYLSLGRVYDRTNEPKWLSLQKEKKKRFKAKKMILSMRGEGELKLSKLNICQNANITDLGFENVSILSWYSGGPVYNYLHELYIPASRDRNRDDRNVYAKDETTNCASLLHAFRNQYLTTELEFYNHQPPQKGFPKVASDCLRTRAELSNWISLARERIWYSKSSIPYPERTEVAHKFASTWNWLKSGWTSRDREHFWSWKVDFTTKGRPQSHKIRAIHKLENLYVGGNLIPR